MTTAADWVAGARPRTLPATLALSAWGSSTSIWSSPSPSTAVAFALPLPLFFEPLGRPRPDALAVFPTISSMPLSDPPSLSSSSVLASLRFTLRGRLRIERGPRGIVARIPWQFRRRHETSLSSCGVESARNRARLMSV